MLKMLKYPLLTALLLTMAMGTAQARNTTDVKDYTYREGTRIDKMGNKFGRGLTNVLTCWIEIPHSIAIEWNKREAVSGVLVGVPKGLTWTAARFFTGTYEILTFPFPMPNDYRPIMEPEWLVTDTWGNNIPEITDMQANDPLYNRDQPTYPNQFRF